MPLAMLVCENGHIVNDGVEEGSHCLHPHCGECGAPTLTWCPHCTTPIPGREQFGYAMSVARPLPNCCWQCGGRFPWADRADCSTDSSPETTALAKVERILTHFPAVVRQLLVRREKRLTLDVKDEYDVQDLLHALLKIDFDDIRREDPSPSHAGQASRVDFVLKAHQIVVEAKKTRRGLGRKEVGDDLIKDIGRYRTHQDCKTLVCFVYDPDHLISNPQELKTDLEGHSTDEMKVVVHISPLL